jgi:hypothetical protein
MAYTDLRFKPGINKEITPYSEENGWVDCDKVRFRFGYPEKLNGWAKNSTNAFLGQCRGLHEWVALSGEAFLGLGTQLKYYIKQGTAYLDVTPTRSTGNSVTFTITSNTALITVTDVNHGCVVNDFVTFTTASAAVGNITVDVLKQEYQITEVVDGNTYKFQPRSQSTIESITITGGLSAANDLMPNASGTPTGSADYQIGTGLNSSVAGTGWGAGLWGGVNNNALQTTITNDIANSGTSTTFPIADRTDIVVDDFILINFEIMKITATTGTSGAGNVTADRAQKGTTRAAHTNGDVLRLISGNADGSNDFNGWGLGIATGTQTTTSNLRIWSHDNFGEDLIINERNGGIYYWDKDEQSTTITPFLRAKELSTLSGTKRSVPQKAAQVLLSDRDRHVIAFGADGLGGSTDAQGNNVQDPMLIRFSSQENPLDWFPTDTNTAGDLRIDAGSKIVQAVETRQQILVITDVAIYAMQFIGPPFTFGINLISSNITIASPRAAVAVNDSVYWMGDAEFYSYAGAVQRIPCTVRDHVFNDFNTGEAEKVVAGSNISFAEIWWFYPSSGSSENNKYVIYNYQENIWYIGSLSRTAWLDRGISSLPVATGTDNYLFDHETGSQDDGSVMTSFIESGDMGISDGNQFSFISRVIPDMNFRESTDEGTTQVNFIFTAKNAPGQAAQNTETNTVEKTVSNSVGIYTNQYQTRLRGRSFTFKIESTGEASRKVLWRLGIPRIDIRSDGRR